MPPRRASNQSHEILAFFCWQYAYLLNDGAKLQHLFQIIVIKIVQKIYKIGQNAPQDAQNIPKRIEAPKTGDAAKSISGNFRVYLE